MYSPPEARLVPFFRLRFHVLLFSYFLAAKKLFPDYQVTGKSSKKNPKPCSSARLSLSTLPEKRPAFLSIRMVKDLITYIGKKVEMTDNARRDLAKELFQKTWSAISNSDDLWKFALAVRDRAASVISEKECVVVVAGELRVESEKTEDDGPVTSETTEDEGGATRMEIDDDRDDTTKRDTTKRKRETKKQKKTKTKWVTLMDLYLHIIISHMGLFYEKMDFKNSSTERGESWLGWGKKILKLFTNKNLSGDQALRELCVRHHNRKDIKEKEAPYDPMKGKIAKEFRKHVFEEIELEMREDNSGDVEAFLQYLEELGYLAEDQCWRVEGKRVIFNTVRAAQEAYDQFHDK